MQLGHRTKPGDPLGDIIFLFATVSALQHIGDDRRSRGRIWSVPVHRLEPPMPLTSRRREELEEPRHVVLSHWPVRFRSCWGSWTSGSP